MYSLFCVCLFVLLGLCILYCDCILKPFIIATVCLPSCPTLYVHMFQHVFRTFSHFQTRLLLLEYRDCLLCWGNVYTSLHEGVASLLRYPREVKIKQLLSSILLPLGLFVSLQPRLNQFWVGSQADIQKIRRQTNEQSSNQLLFQENKEWAGWCEDRLMDGRVEKMKDLEDKKEKRGSDMRKICGDSKYFGVSLCQKGGYSFPGPSPLASCRLRTSWRYCENTKTHPYE